MEGTVSYVGEMFGLEDRVVVVTGAGGALAGSLAEGFLLAGARVALWVHRPEAAAEVLAAHSGAAGDAGRVIATAVDTGNRAQVEAAFAEAEAALGRPNVLVNAVGGNRGKSPFVDAELDVFEEVLELNLVAGLLVPTQVFARRWIAAKARGSIINFASMGSYVPLSGVWAYNAAKAGVLNLTLACAKEFGPAGIRVNAIAPGFFLGRQNKALLVADEASGELTPRGAEVQRRTPFGRFGMAEELRGAALFLASDRASGFVTGVCLPVDGGFLADNI
jgi:NAD(P)-dependent dehydrogenase (short-subunit alcohol dehydrogenase family)